MNEGKNLRQAVDSVSRNALDDALGIAFGANTENEVRPVDAASEVIGRYKLLEQIGEGGFGVVYMAEQQEPIRRRVALKIIKLGMDTKQVVARFEAERQALAMMEHENIASVLDAGATESGRPYFVMELVRGVTITEFCDRNKLSIRERLQLFVSVCKAVQHAHQKGIIHRDLKPNNVMVTLRDGAPVPKVIDFGVAKATQMQLTEKTVFTRFGQFIGTPAYMSPEQFEMGELDVDTRSDIFSLGVLMYELLTGTTPIEYERLRRASYSEMQRMICHQEPPRPSTRLSHSGEALATISAQRAVEPKKLGHLVRGELDWIVMKALDKDRARRYDSASGLAADVLRYLNNEPVTASPPSAGYVLQKFAGKYKRGIAVGMAFAALLLSSTLVSAWLAYRAMHAEDRAVRNEDLAKGRLHQETLAKQEMQRQRDLAEKLGVEARNAAERGRSLLYVAHMNLIQRELDTGNDPRIIHLLNLHKPKDGQRDLRGFEWYRAWALYNRNPWTWRHHASVTSVACCPSAEIVVSGCSDGRLQVWDATSGQIIVAVNGHSLPVTDIAFSPDGRIVATGSLDSTVKLWTFESGRLDSDDTVIQCNGGALHIDFSSNGTYLAIGTGDAGARAAVLLDMRTREERTIENRNRPARSVAFSHDDSTLALCGDDTFVNLYDVQNARIIETINTGLPAVVASAFSPIDDTLALGDASGAVARWTKQTGCRTLGRHAGLVSSLAFSADGKMLTSSGNDHLIKLWYLEHAGKVNVLRGHASLVESIAFSRDDKMVVSASADHTVRLWDLARNEATIHLTAHQAPIAATAFSPEDGRTLVSGSYDGSVMLWDVEEARPVETLPVYGGVIRCIAVSADGATIAYAGGPESEAANILLWDTEKKVVRRTAKEHSRAVLALAFSPDGRTLASGGDEGLLNLWDVATGTIQATLENNTQAIVSVDWSPDHAWLATCSFHQNTITLWNAQNPQERRVLAGHEDWVTSVAFSPDGGILASGSIDNTVRVWDVATGTEKFVMAGHGGRVDSVAFSPDGMTLASIGRDDRVRLWDVEAGQEKADLACHPTMDAGLAVAFSPDGRTLAAADGNSVILHRAATDQDFHLHESPETPRNRLPASRSVVDADVVQLEAIPYFHRHSQVTHLSSHWQVRRADASYSVPVVNRSGIQRLTSLNLERGVLAPNTTYFWHVAFTGSNHRSTPFSHEMSFTTSGFSMEAVPFDLTPHFNRDIVKNPGDADTDSIDASPGSHLLVSGFDGTRTDNPRVNGLPMERQLGSHTLGDYDGSNAIQTALADEDKTPIRISVPEGHYHFVRFAVVGGNGNSDMPVVFEYEDGTTQREIIRCDDWFHDIAENRYGLLRKGLLPVINEMDRFHENEYRDDNAAAVFEFTAKVDPEKKLLSLTLETNADDAQYTDTALWPNHSRARFNLMAATGITISP